ncbi:MAG: DUF3575 domain-containing protein [Candidatus Limisoma sp.]
MSYFYRFILFILCLSLYKDGIAIGSTADNYGYPDYVLFQDDIDLTELFRQNSAISVLYKSNQVELRDAAALDSIVATLQRIRQDRYTCLQRIFIAGSSSPEGSVENNFNLGENRALTLKKYILSHTDIPDSLITSFNLEEDWYNVEKYLLSRDFSYAAAILKIMAEQSDPIRRKRDIQAIDNGKTWRNLISKVFPILRNARLIVQCTHVSDSIDTEPTGGLMFDSGLLNAAIECPPAINFFDVRQEVNSSAFIALKTNALFVALLTANLSVEAQITKHFSIEVPVYYSPYDITDNLRLRLFGTQPEVRYWAHPAGEGWFCGFHATLAGFNVSTPSSLRYQDSDRAMWGVGLGGGWVHNFGAKRQWFIECNLGVGYLNSHWDAFRNWHNGPMCNSGSFRYWGITRAGVSIGYKWNYRK